MISLGVSSISDTWFAFAQNVKKVEDYTELIEQGVFPIFKGHILTPEDLFIRKHILALMCTGKTNWDQSSALPSYFTEGLERMQELAADGFVEIKQASLCVTPLGKRFLRNICMALDSRLYASQPATQLFSMAG
jgi:oxygen-independent coproporphyrinogen-3 oxidase